MDINPDTPLRLKAAAERAFPGGGMTASGLRREAARGRLVIERVAGKDYTTLSAIEKMRKLCRVEAKGFGSGCGVSGETRTENSHTTPSGLSKTEIVERAHAAALAMLQAPSER